MIQGFYVGRTFSSFTSQCNVRALSPEGILPKATAAKAGCHYGMFPGGSPRIDPGLGFHNAEALARINAGAPTWQPSTERAL